MRGRMKLAGRTAVVTGAASGIGRAVAEVLAGRGCHLALVDVDRNGLAAAADALRGRGIRVSRHRVDVADRDTVAALPAAVRAEHPGVDVLVNNAGVAVGGTFAQVAEENFDWLLGINFHGVVRMTRAFLPLLQTSDDARLVNVSSIFGIIAPAGQTAYSASKFAVRGFSMALAHELEGSRVGVTVVYPGGIATRIADRARVPDDVSPEELRVRLARHNRLLRIPPAVAGRAIVRGIERRKRRVLIGLEAWAVVALERLAPLRYWALLKGRLDP